MTKKIHWGVLSTAKIGVEKVIPAMQKGNYSEIKAIASRNLKKSEDVAKKLNIPKAYGSYEALLADHEIEAIYNPLPNHLHVPWSIKALEAGKHVLCEKPIALTSTEAQRLIVAANKFPNLKIMEAFMYRFHPQWQKTRELVNQGIIGELKSITSVFTYYNINKNDIRNMADIGGGGLLDIGCYCISLSRFILGKEPKRVCGIVDYDPQFKTDRFSSALMDFQEVTSTFICSTQIDSYQHANILGTKGRIEIEIPFTPPPDKPCRLWLQHHSKVQEIEFDACDQYTIQGDMFSQAIMNNTPVPTPLDDAFQNMKIIEAIVESATQNKWIDLS